MVVWARAAVKTRVAESPEAHPNSMQAVTSQNTGKKKSLKREMHAIKILWKHGYLRNFKIFLSAAPFFGRILDTDGTVVVMNKSP